MAKKLYDLSVKTREYVNQQGEKKGVWQTIGSVMQNDDSSKFIMLAKWFNPAGVPDLSGKNGQSESILVSMFDPKQQDGGQTTHGAAKANGYAPAPAGGVDDDIPF